MNFEAIVPGRKVSPMVTRGVVALNLSGETHALMIVFALRRWKESKGKEYFHTYETIGNEVVVTDGNKNILMRHSVDSMQGITEKMYTIIDDYGKTSKEGLVTTLLLTTEY